MKILITGAGGQPGQNLSKICHASHGVFALDRQALDISLLQDVERIIDEPATSWFELAEAISEETRQYEALAVKRIIPISTEQFPTPAKQSYGLQ